MKKVLVAAAGLMLVGTMVSSAMAEFEFSGDARNRFYYQKDYNQFPFANETNTENDTRWASRVRMQTKATTKGGAYAVTRLKVGNGEWNGGNSGTTSVVADRAYIGVPFGSVVYEGGRQGRDITPFLYYANDVDGLDLNWSNDNMAVVAFYDIANENFASEESDNDNQVVGAVMTYKFMNGWDMLLSGAQNINDVGEGSKNAFIGTVQVNGAVGEVALTAELATQGKHWATNNDDDTGVGGYLQAGIPVGPVDLTGMIGFTVDGYQMVAAEFGPFVMLNDVSMIATGLNFSAYGETFFVDLNPTYQVSESLTLGANFAYATIDDAGLDYGQGDKDRDVYEIAATANYAVVDGAALKGYLGYMNTDNITDDNPVGFGLSLEVSF